VRTSPPLRQFHRACKSLLVMLLVIFEILRLPTGSRQLLLFASLTVIASTVTLYAFYLCRLIEIGPSPSVLFRVVTLCNPTSYTNGERRSPHTSNRGSHPYCPLHAKASRLLICGCTRAQCNPVPYAFRAVSFIY
jgi:hypothetical protein